MGKGGGVTLKCKTFIGGCRQIDDKKLQVMSMDSSFSATVASAASCLQVTMANGTGFIDRRINIWFVLQNIKANPLYLMCSGIKTNLLLMDLALKSLNLSSD